MIYTQHAPPPVHASLLSPTKFASRINQLNNGGSDLITTNTINNDKKALKLFLKKNKNKEVVILDIPLLLENKINKKKDILVFIDAKKIDIERKIKKRINFNHKLFNKFKKIQYSSKYKKKRSHFIIKNNFTKKSVKIGIKYILNKIL